LFKFRSNRRSRARARRITLINDPHSLDEGRACPDDPAAQVELVSQTIEKLDEVKHLVMRLPELPVGSRADLLNQLASTSANLRALYFLDAIY
jgi:hypothetical protein